MKKLFGNPELISKNKRVAHRAKLEAKEEKKEYKIGIDYEVIECASYSRHKAITVHAQNEAQAKEIAEEQIWEQLDGTEEIESITCNVIGVNSRQPTDDQTLDMFKTYDQDKKT